MPKAIRLEGVAREFATARWRQKTPDFWPGCALRKIVVAKCSQWAQRYCTENLVAQSSTITLSQEARRGENWWRKKTHALIRTDNMD